MRHVDDGTIHAWLDGQVTDPVEAAWIEEHLRDCGACSAQFDEQRAIFEQTDALLAAAAPLADAGRPAFDALVAKAADAGPLTGRGTGPRFRQWIVSASWAASIALAVAIGWTARGLTPIAPQQSDARPKQQQQRGGDSATGNPNTGPSVEPGAPLRPAPPAASGERRPTQPSETRSPTRPGTRALAPATPPQNEVADARDGVTLAPEQPTIDAPPPALIDGTSPQVTLAQPSLFPVSRQPSGLVNSAAEGRGAGGGRGGGGRAAAGGGRGQGQGQAGRVQVDGVIVNTAAPAFIAAGVAYDVGWHQVPRTEAAARSGMPIYGIDGLMPIATMLNADATSVRTTYRLESGETVDITQQKILGAQTGTPAGSVTVAAERPVVDVQNARQTVVNSPFFPSLWTIVRGDVQLTLRGPDAQALGARLRLD
jgi:hypothetical protein